MSEPVTLRWEDYIITGDRAQEAYDRIEAFASSIVFDPEDRMYPSEDYIGNIGSEIPNVEKELGVTFRVDF